MSNTLSVSKKLEAKLKEVDPEIQQYVIALHKKKRTLEIENMRLNDRIDVFQSKVKERKQSKFHPEKLSPEELNQFTDLIKKAET